MHTSLQEKFNLMCVRGVKAFRWRFEPVWDPHCSHHVAISSRLIVVFGYHLNDSQLKGRFRILIMH